MTFWKITETRMNCLISHQEIQAMGYEISELTEDRERTQEFLNRLLEKGREVLGMKMDGIVQSFCGAFLPDKSLLLTISCGEPRPAEVTDGFLPMALAQQTDDQPILSFHVLFPSLEYVVQFCEVFDAGQLWQSRLYKHEDIYYLILDFHNTEEGRRAAGTALIAEEFEGIVEQYAISEMFLKEHECELIAEDAVGKLKEMAG